MSQSTRIVEAWLVTYALGKGIIKGFATFKEDPRLVCFQDNKKSFASFALYYLNKDVFLSEQEAIQAAELLRLKKIALREKRLSKLRTQKIKIVE